ncbi:hypothetical protein ACWFRN_03895, partial [Streptomyces celluloflavus]
MSALHGGDAAGVPGALADAGLLSPVRAGTLVEAAVGDLAWLQAMLDAEAALARAQAALGTVPGAAAPARRAPGGRRDPRGRAAGGVGGEVAHDHRPQDHRP